MADTQSPPRRKPRFRERNALKEQQEARHRPIPTVAPQATQAETVSSAPRRMLFPRVTVESVLYGTILGAGFLLRIWDVGSRAMHGDEAEHAWFAWHLYNGTGYQYDPVYHGPLQFIVTSVFFFLFGVSEVTARLMAVLFGTALIATPFFLRRWMGRPAALLAALYIAFSPAFVYVSRLERDDIFTAFFAMTLTISLFAFVHTRRERYLYFGGASVALSLAAMENTYITLFVFGTFALIVAASEVLGVSALGNRLTEFWSRTGTPARLDPRILAGTLGVLVLAFILVVTTGVYLPFLFLLGLGLVLVVNRGAILGSASGEPAFLKAFSGTSRRQWLNVGTIMLAILVLTYSTFGTNLRGIWDSTQPLLNSGHACAGNSYFLNGCRRDIIGGLFYWLSQHQVHRGGQPWFYYTLLFGLYEQIAVVLGLGGIVWFLRRPTVFTSFLIYWAVVMFAVYSWAGEKFPWLMIHPLLPFSLLAAMFVADIVRVTSPMRWLILGVLALLTVFELHSMFEVNFVYGADPVEMMVYVQSAPDTPKVAKDIVALSNKVTNGNDLHVTIDADESWPFAWYLRDMTNVAYPAYPDILNKTYVQNPVILVDESHQAGLLTKIGKSYTGHKYRLRWWFPEDYKQLTWSSFGRDLVNPGYWRVVGQWLTERRPLGPKQGISFYYYVKKNLASPY